MSKKLIIFDCDGVLVDSEYISNKILSEAFLNYGYLISTEECIKKFTGVDEYGCREIILKESGVDIPPNYWELLQPTIMEAYKTEAIPLIEPVLELLELLKIPRCVASNSSRKHVIHCLENANQFKYFNEEFIFSAQQVTKPKPAADLFLFAAKNMGVAPENCIVIEDSSAGAKAAIAAGMHVIMYLGGKHARFDWYQNQIALHQKPMMFSCNELAEALNEMMSPANQV